MKLSFEGVFEVLHEAYRAKLLDARATGVASAEQMDVTHLAGPFIIFLTLALFAFILYHVELHEMKQGLKRVSSFKLSGRLSPGKFLISGRKSEEDDLEA